jgi:hypothetical protein
MPWLPIIIIAIVALAFSKAGGTTGPGPGPFVDVEETITPYGDYKIAVGKGPADAPHPWRWRVDDATGPVANATDWADTADAALAAGKAWVDANASKLPAPPVPTPPKPPLPPLEGTTQPPQSIACETTLRDGAFVICLYPSGGGKYAYRATDGAGMPVATEGGYASKLEAKVGAWRMLATMPTGVTSSTRHGVRVGADSRLDLVDRDAYMARAVPILNAELAKGERDPMGLLLAIFGSFWPSYNPLRFRPYGNDLVEVAGRIKPLIPNAELVATEVWGPYTATGNA